MPYLSHFITKATMVRCLLFHTQATWHWSVTDYFSFCFNLKFSNLAIKWKSPCSTSILKTLNVPDQSQSHHQCAYCEQHVSSPCSGQSWTTSAFDPSERRESRCLRSVPALRSGTMLAKIIWLSGFGMRVWHALLFLASGHILAMSHFRLVLACNIRGKYTAPTPSMITGGIIVIFLPEECS